MEGMAQVVRGLPLIEGCAPAAHTDTSTHSKDIKGAKPAARSERQPMHAQKAAKNCLLFKHL